MDLSLSNLAIVENSSWASQPTEVVDATTVAKPFGLYFENAIRTKLTSVFATSKSVEFDRQVLLALHDSALGKCQAHLVDATLNGQVYLAVSTPRVRNSLLFVQHNDFSLHAEFRALLRSSYGVEFAQLLLLHLIALVIDRIADYWNAIAQARTAWLINLVLIAFRQQLKAGLQFKPLHTPLRLFPSSIHPIEVSA